MSDHLRPAVRSPTLVHAAAQLGLDDEPERFLADVEVLGPPERLVGDQCLPDALGWRLDADLELVFDAGDLIVLRHGGSLAAFQPLLEIGEPRGELALERPDPALVELL
jgi:hypothetical protein